MDLDHKILLGTQKMVRKYVVGPLNVALGWDPETLSLIKEKTLTWVDGRILVRAVRKKKKSVVFVVRIAHLCLFIQQPCVVFLLSK